MDEIHTTPIVIVAPLINKYYILDINARRSLMRHLVGQGFTVFVARWKNPTANMRNTTFDGYVLRGVLEPVNAARDICGSEQAHLVGYCIGGIIVAVLPAWLNRASDHKAQLPVAHCYAADYARRFL